MNKLIVEQNVIDLQDEDVEVRILPNEVEFRIEGNVTCRLQEMKNKTIKITLKENSHFTFEFFGVLESSQNAIEIYNEENSGVDLHFACTYKKENNLVITNKITTSNNKNNILIRAVEEGGTLTVKATGFIEEGTKNNSYLEDIKAITTSGQSLKIKPNLLVRSDSVVASHNATISPVRDTELFYLESKGIEKKRATSLIKEGFLKEILLFKEEQ